MQIPLFFCKDTDIPSLTILLLQNPHPGGIFPSQGVQGPGPACTTQEQRFHHFPSSGHPWGCEAGAGTLFPSQAAARRQEGLFDLAAVGRAAVLRCVWKAPALAVALIRRAVALKVERGDRLGPGYLDDSAGTELITHSPQVI